MNTANLQIEGLLMAIASLTSALREKGVMSKEELDAALGEAERSAAGDAGRPEELSPANVEAVLFPIRFLRAVNAGGLAAETPAFSVVASSIKRAKGVF